MYTMTTTIWLLCFCMYVAEGIYDTSKTISSKHRRYSNEKTDSPAQWADDNGIWSTILEEWALRPSSVRDSRVLNLSAPQVYVTNRIGEEDVVSTTNKKFPGSNTVINHKQIQNGGFIPNQGIGHQFASNGGYQFGNGGSYRPNDNYVIPPREISETDLYLLGAMEKLVYRLDFMEKRMRHMEQMLYYVINSGNKDTALDEDPCPKNFTRAGSNCYHFGIENKLNWKSASATCKKLDSVLLEMENEKESQKIVAHIQTKTELREKDFWTGGLNPGLLWIWSNSAKPVATENSATNATNNALDIKGSGRCLKLSYKPTVKTYNYFGEDCSSRQYYVCEKQENTISNEISRMARQIFPED